MLFLVIYIDYHLIKRITNDGDADNNFEDGDMISMLMMLCWQHKLSYIIFTIYKVDTSISLHNFHSVLLLIDFML